MKHIGKWLWIPLIMVALAVLAAVIYLGYLFVTVVIPLIPVLIYSVLK